MSHSRREQFDIAIRVLNALSVERTFPSARDVIQLRELAETDEERTMEMDELARTVIARERKRMGGQPPVDSTIAPLPR